MNSIKRRSRSFLPSFHETFLVRERRGEQESSQGHHWVRLHLMKKGISREKAHEEHETIRPVSSVIQYNSWRMYHALYNISSELNLQQRG